MVSAVNLDMADVRSFADVFTILLRLRWVAMHLQRLLIFLHKICKRVRPSDCTASNVGIHRLRTLTHIVHVRFACSLLN
jgi:hypothetical protein